MEHPKYLKGVFFCLIATLSWGVMFPVMTDALNKIDPFTFTALRYSIAGIAFIILLYVKEGVAALVVDRQEISLAWVFGSAGFAGFGFLVFYGQQLAGSTGALTASIMMATMPLQGLLVTWVFRGVRPPLFWGAARYFQGRFFCVVTTAKLFGQHPIDTWSALLGSVYLWW
jgi:drug/metabolite transporter (DMT)-like permease